MGGKEHFHECGTFNTLTSVQAGVNVQLFALTLQSQSEKWFQSIQWHSDQTIQEAATVKVPLFHCILQGQLN